MTNGEQLLRGQSGRILIVVSFGWLTIQCGRLVLSPFVPEITSELGVSSFKIGLSFTTLWGVYALLQYPSGRLSDVLSRKTVLLVGLSCTILGFIALGTAQTYPLFLASTAIVGLGAGFYPTAARALVAEYFVNKRSKAFGIHTGSGDAGGVAAAGLSTAALSFATWRSAFIPILIMLGAVLIFYYRWSNEAIVLKWSDLEAHSIVRRLLSNPIMRGFLFSYVLYVFTWQSTAAFLPAYFELGKGFDATTAKVAFGLLFASGMISKPSAGFITSWIPRKLLIPGVLSLSACALVGIIFVTSPLPALVLVGCFGIFLMAFPPLMQSLLMDKFPNDSTGGDLGAFRSVYIGIGALGPTYVGAVTSIASYATAFVGLVGCLLISSISVTYLTR